MPDLGYKLYADASTFESGLRSANSKVEGLKKTMAGLGLSVGGAAGLAALQSAALDAAQAIRKANEDSGRATDANVAAAARYADQLDELKAKALEGTASVVGFVNRIGESFGKMFAEALYGSAQVAAAEASERAADAADKRLALARKVNAEKIAGAERLRDLQLRDASTAEQIAAMREDEAKLAEQLTKQAEGTVEHQRTKNLLAETGFNIARAERKQSEENLKVLNAQRDAHERANRAIDQQADAEKQIDLLLQEQGVLIQEKIDAGQNVVKQAEAERQIQANNLKLIEAQKKAANEKAKDAHKAAQEAAKDRAQIDTAKGKVGEARGALETAQADRGKLSLQELASISDFDPTASIDTKDQARKARESLKLQQQGEDARKQGDSAKALDLFGQADAAKSGIEALKSSDRADPLAKFKDALKDSETELAAIRKAVEGKFKNQ